MKSRNLNSLKKTHRMDLFYFQRNVRSCKKNFTNLTVCNGEQNSKRKEEELLNYWRDVCVPLFFSFTFFSRTLLNISNFEKNLSKWIGASRIFSQLNFVCIAFTANSAKHCQAASRCNLELLINLLQLVAIAIISRHDCSEHWTYRYRTKLCAPSLQSWSKKRKEIMLQRGN